MNENVVKGNWKQVSGKIKAKWGKLTDNDLKMAEGNEQYLVGKLQEEYGLAQEEIKKNLRDIGYYH